MKRVDGVDGDGVGVCDGGGMEGEGWKEGEGGG